MQKRRRVFLLALALILCWLAGCAVSNETPAAAFYDGVWYVATDGMECRFEDGKIYKNTARSKASDPKLDGIYTDAGDHLEANLAGVGSVRQTRLLYPVDTADRGQVLCESPDGTGTVYFYRDPLAALLALEDAETDADSAKELPAEPDEDAAPEGEVLRLEPLEDEDSPSSPPDDRSMPDSAEADAPDKAEEPAVEDTKTSGTVWIPKSGSKYHSDPSCSGMKNPKKVSLSEARSKGYTPCKRCY